MKQPTHRDAHQFRIAILHAQRAHPRPMLMLIAGLMAAALRYWVSENLRGDDRAFVAGPFPLMRQTRSRKVGHRSFVPVADVRAARTFALRCHLLSAL